MFKYLTCLFLLSSTALAQLPSQPSDVTHPGSPQYSFSVKQEKIQISGRAVDVFLPLEAKAQGIKVPVIVFGHGQAIDVAGYDLSFQHLAKKGIAVIHPTYDTGFFDQDWRRMADDFNNLTAQSLQKYADVLDPQKILYAGHSKGGYIALMAAGAPKLAHKVSSLVLFAPAGFDADYLKTMNAAIPLTLIWSDGDTVIKRSLIDEIFVKSPSKYKQLIQVNSYPSAKADHFFPLNKSYFFGGKNGASAYHYFGVWKWLLGAAWDLDQNNLSNPYIYGSETDTTGVSGLRHSVQRSW